MSRTDQASSRAPFSRAPFGIVVRRPRTIPPARLERDPDRCVHCGGCVARCDTGALAVDRATFRITVDTTRCRGCRRCIAACGYHAITLGGTGDQENQP